VAVDQAGDGEQAGGVQALAGLIWIDLTAGYDGADAVASDGDVVVVDDRVPIILTNEDIAAGDEQIEEDYTRHCHAERKVIKTFKSLNQRVNH